MMTTNNVTESHTANQRFSITICRLLSGNLISLKNKTKSFESIQDFPAFSKKIPNPLVMPCHHSWPKEHATFPARFKNTLPPIHDLPGSWLCSATLAHVGGSLFISP